MSSEAKDWILTNDNMFLTKMFDLDLTFEICRNWCEVLRLC